MRQSTCASMHTNRYYPLTITTTSLPTKTIKPQLHSPNYVNGRNLHTRHSTSAQQRSFKQLSLLQYTHTHKTTSDRYLRYVQRSSFPPFFFLLLSSLPRVCLCGRKKEKQPTKTHSLCETITPKSMIPDALSVVVDRSRMIAAHDSTSDRIVSFAHPPLQRSNLPSRRIASATEAFN